jgi:hypothetical protein
VSFTNKNKFHQECLATLMFPSVCPSLREKCGADFFPNKIGKKRGAHFLSVSTGGHQHRTDGCSRAVLTSVLGTNLVNLSGCLGAILRAFIFKL